MNFVGLADVCRIIQGGRLRLSGKNFVREGFPAYGAGGLNGYLAEKEFDETGIVLSAIGARCGKCFLATGSWTSLANTQIIFPDPAKVDVRFLWYQLDDENRWPRSGAAQPFIRPSNVKAHRIALPPLPEQQRIVAILDEVFEGIAAATANTEKNLADAQELFESELRRAFDTETSRWPSRHLGDVLKTSAGGTPLSTGKAFYEGVPFLGS